MYTRGPVHKKLCTGVRWGSSAWLALSHRPGALRGCPTDSSVPLPRGSRLKPQSVLPLQEATRMIRGRCCPHHLAAAATVCCQPSSALSAVKASIPPRPSQLLQICPEDIWSVLSDITLLLV
uniref:Uncharacterized protein n=1 Tax=Pipistrellus kuhlii TaxID=59472 RepID=A0A7J8A7M3_PIPKU|nr:hypothetical protein mPipKuh1_008814 [Pipistrellus kuhlii]